MQKVVFLRGILWINIFILVSTLLISSFTRLAEVTHFIKDGKLPANGTIDLGYVQNPVLAFLHILPGCVFLLSGAWQFIRPLRNRLIHVHRWNGKIFILSGLIIGITGVAMGIFLGFGGVVEALAAIIFGIYLLYALLKAYKLIKNKQYGLHREWMIRAYGIGLAVATIRPLTIFFFTFSEIPFHIFFGLAFWIAFISHAVVTEIWIRYTRRIRI